MILCVTDDLIISLCLHVLYPYYLFICHSMSVCSQIVIPIAGPGYVIQNSILEHCCQLICCISIQSRCIIMEVLDVLYISLHSPCITIEVLDLQIRFLSKTYIAHLFLRVLFDDRLCVSVQIILYFFFIPAATRGESS